MTTKKKRYRNNKSFNSESAAEKFIEKTKKYYPQWVFSVKRRTFPGKFKARYMVRSIEK